MNRKSEKRLTICVPQSLLDKFKWACNENFKSMSDTLRDFIKKHIEETEAWTSIPHCSCGENDCSHIRQVKEMELHRIL